MSENKRVFILIGGLVSAALCTTGFAGRNEALRTEKVTAFYTEKIADNILNIHYTDTSCEETIQAVCLKIGEERKEEAKEARKREAKKKAVDAVSEDTKNLLASIIFCEAGNQPYEGQVAVGAVVMNRVKSGVFPGTIEEVVYQSGQFVPAFTGWLDQVRSSGGYTVSAMQAATDAISGANPVGECLYFDRGGSGIQIGDHFFH